MSLTKIALIAMIIAAVGKAFGLFRELMIAAYYGDSAYADAYIMSTMVPLILMGFIQSFAVVFTPTYVRVKDDKTVNYADDYMKQLSLVVVLVSTLVIGVSQMIMPRIVDILAPGFNDETKSYTYFFARLSIFTGLTSALVELCLAYLRCNSRYIFASLVCLIVSPVECVFIFWGGTTHKWLIVLGPVVAQLLQLFLCILLIEIIFSKHRNIEHKHVFLTNEIKHSFATVVPIFMGSMASQISTYFDKMFASCLQEGTVSSLNYAEKIYSMINTLVFMTISTILFPNIAELCHKKDKTALKEQLRSIISIVIMIGVVISVATFFFGNCIVGALYERGSFDRELTNKTAMSFSLYMIGFFALGIHEILSRVFYGLERVKDELIIGLIIVAVNISLDYVLVNALGQSGLPIATSISLLSSIPVNCMYLRREIGGYHIRVFLIVFVKCLASALLGYGMVYCVIKRIGVSNYYVILFFAMIIGSIITFILLKCLRVKEINDLINSIYKRLGAKS